MQIIVTQINNIVLRRSLTTEELEARKVTVAIPNLSYTDWSWKPISIYFFANYQVPDDINDKAALEALADNLPVMYNCVDNAASSGLKWESGFTMFAKREVSVKVPEYLNFNITLRRTVAKIAVRVSIDPDFSANHQGGKLEITGASVVRAASDCRLLLPGTVEIPSAMDFSHRVGAVQSETDKEFVFYVFPNPQLISGSPDNPALVIEGIFDRDGNAKTTDDLFDVRYEVFINQTDRGRIERNRVYKYDLKVIGLNGAQLESAYRIDDWLTPDTQAIEAGN